MRISKICLFIVTISYLGCQNKPQTNLLAFRVLDRSLVISNTFIKNQNNILFELIKNKSNEHSMSAKTSDWQAKAELVKKLSNETNDYIDNLKINLKQEAGFTMINDREFFREEDVNAVQTLFEKKGRAEELKQCIEKYENEIFVLPLSAPLPSPSRS